MRGTVELIISLWVHHFKQPLSYYTCVPLLIGNTDESSFELPNINKQKAGAGQLQE